MSKQPVSFYEAFKQVVLYQTGLTVSENELHKELLEHELELALRLEGLAGDSEQVEEPKQSEQSKDSKREGKEKEGKEANQGKGKGKGEGKGEGKGKANSEPSWSADADRLLQLVKRLGPRNPNLSSSAFLKPFFRDLRLPQLHIANFSEALQGFNQLTSLDVSRNSLTDIAYLPPNLRFLRAYNNKLLRLSCKPLQSLCFLGLGFNPLGDALEIGKFPNLLSLDAGNTDMASLTTVLAKLKMLPKLRHLYLLGSPICLLPFYRLRVLREIPLQALDAVVLSKEEMAEVAEAQPPEAVPAKPTEEVSEKAEEVGPVGGGPDWCRLTLAFGELKNYKELLKEALMSASDEEAQVAAAEAAQAAGEEVVERDALAEKCGQDGLLRLSFQLPSGVWVATSSINLAKKTYEVKEGEPPPPVVLKDFLKLKALRQENGEKLNFDLCFDITSDLSGLRALQKWLNRGLQIKLWYLPPKPPPTPETVAEAEASADATAEAPEGTEAGAEAEPGEGCAGPPATEAPADIAICVGGCVVPLASMFQRACDKVSAEQRPCPEPWQHTAEAGVVPMAQWLNPDIQVPKVKKEDREKERPLSGNAQLDLAVTLYGMPLEDVVESEEEAPPAAKAKAKAKGKK